MAVTTKGILSPRSADLKILDTTNICSYNVLVKMGVGGVSAKTSYRLEDLVVALDFHIRRTNERIDDELARVGRLRRARRQLELQIWKTSPRFCKTR
jgi:hypothetical protein